MSIPLEQIARLLQCSIPDSATTLAVRGISSCESAEADQITFLSQDKYLPAAQSSKAAAVIVRTGITINGKINLAVKDPYAGYAKVAQLFEDTTPLFGPQQIHLTACIDPSAVVDPSAWIGPFSVIGKECHVGANTVIGAHCVIENKTSIGSRCRIHSGVIICRDVVIGNRVIIQSGTVIGSEGFGNAVENGAFIRIPCFGTVVIEDDVEIGANVTVDRGNFEPTLIRKGVRIDNLVQIAHNVEVGENSAMAAQVGISGSVKIGRGVLLAGQAGLAGHLEIGDGAFIGAKAGISKSVLPGQKVTGYPARDLMKMRRIEATMQDLPEMAKKLKSIQKEIDILKGVSEKA